MSEVEAVTEVVGTLDMASGPKGSSRRKSEALDLM